MKLNPQKYTWTCEACGAESEKPFDREEEADKAGLEHENTIACVKGQLRLLTERVITLEKGNKK